MLYTGSICFGERCISYVCVVTEAKGGTQLTDREHAVDEARESIPVLRLKYCELIK